MENFLLFASLSIDRVIQLAATHSFMHGHGILQPMAYVSNALEVSYVPFQGWPPGLTFSLLPSYFLFDDLILVNRITDCIFIVLFFIAVRGLINRLFYENRKETLALFCLLNAFNFSPIHYYTSTDLYSVTFLIFAFCFLADRLTRRSSGINNSLAISVFLFLAAFNRFAYLPLAVVIPFSLILIGKKQNDKKLLLDGFNTFVISGGLTLGLYLFQKLYYGGTYLAGAAIEMHPENLLRFDPFIFRSFFFIDPFESRLAAGGWKLSLLHLTGMAITLFFLWAFIRFLFPGKKEKFFIPGLNVVFLLTGVTLIGMLMALSLVSASQSFTSLPWTYVAETRYYAPIMVMVQIYFCGVIFTYKKNWLTAVFSYFAIITIIFSVFYFSFKHYKVFVRGEREGTTDFDSRTVLALCKKVREVSESNETVLVASPVLKTAILPAIAGGIPVSDYDSLLMSNMAGVKMKTILVECDRPLTPSQQKFIESNQCEFSFTIEDKDWYQANLK